MLAPALLLAAAQAAQAPAPARLESGRSSPSTRTLEKLAAATGSKLRIILDPADDKRAA